MRMERRVGKFMRKFMLPENANTDVISVICQDGFSLLLLRSCLLLSLRSPRPLRLRLFDCIAFCGCWVYNNMQYDEC